MMSTYRDAGRLSEDEALEMRTVLEQTLEF